MVGSNQILYLRRNTLQTQQKVDKVYTVLQEMVNWLTNNENRRQLIDGFTSLELSSAEIDDFLYRLRSLVNKSSYHDQIMLLQISPITWGWKKFKFFPNVPSARLAKPSAKERKTVISRSQWMSVETKRWILSCLS
jgi:hypothetical protein